jgi:hypothetical protein
MEKLINIAVRIAKKFPSSNLTDIYSYFMGDKFLNQISKSFNPSDIVKLFFLIKAYKEGRELKDMADRLSTDLFTFSIIEVYDDYAETTCDDCNGDGTVECWSCYGQGKEDCSDCDGTGEDEENNTCNLCDGDGSIECDTCEGDGTMTCDTCEGTGEVRDSNYVNYELKFYVSIEKEVFNNLELLSEDEEITQNTGRFFKIDGYTLYLGKKFYDQSSEYTDNLDETLFKELNRTPDFITKTNGEIRDDELIYFK